MAILNWASKDIEALKAGFLVGMSMKELARDLQRTPTALNKALSRFNIRERKRFNKPARTPSELQALQKKKTVVKYKKSPDREVKFTILDEVVNYLGNYGYKIEQKAIKRDSKFIAQYFFEKKPISETRLVLIANSIRLDCKKPIFVIQAPIEET